MRRNAHTLAELVVVVLIMAVLASVALPRLKFEAIRRNKASNTACKLVADLRKTRSLALRDAAVNKKGYELEMVGSPPYSSYIIVDRDAGDTVYTGSIDAEVMVTVSGLGSKFKFGELGNITAGAELQINVSAQGKSYAITFVGATGTVKLTEN